jgi:hypothetical protein
MAPAGAAADPRPRARVGEVERIVELSASLLATPHGPCQLATGIISDVDLTYGDGVAEVLDARIW